MKTIVLESVNHKNENRLLLRFEKDEPLLQLLKQISGIKFSATFKAWHIANTKQNFDLLFTLCKGKAWLNYDALKKAPETKTTKIIPQHKIELEKLNANATQKIETFKSWLKSKRYSENTIKTYTDALKAFLRFYNAKAVEEITNDDVIQFNNQYILAKEYSSSFQNQVINAIKLFFNTVQNKTIVIESVHRPKREKLLPNVLSKEEIKLILNAHSNIKHKAMLSLIYSCGLRCGELLNLKPEHIDSKRGIILIKQAKGKKDRIAPLSLKIIEILREYFMLYKPSIYLFEGQTKGTAYDARSLQNVLKQALEKVEIKKPVSLHWLRHSYATHLLENGTDLRYIQEILGHSSSKTTEIYTHVSTKSIQKITSPFDLL